MSREQIPVLLKFRTALQNIANDRVEIIGLGTSSMQGANATTYTQRFLQLLSAKIARDYYGSKGTKYVSPQADNTGYGYTGTHTTENKGLSLLTAILTDGATMTRSPFCSGFTIYFVEGAGYLPWTLTVDGVPQTVIPSTALSGDHHTGEITVSGLSYGTHTVVVTAPNPGTTKITGMLVQDYSSSDASKGIAVFNSGHGGFNTDNFVGQIELFERIRSIDPKLIIYMPGTNDYGASMPIVNYTANVRSIVRDLKRSAPNGDILLVTPYKRLDLSPSVSWQSYRDANAAIAVEFECGYVDVTDKYPSSAALDSQNLIDTDNLHQNDRGHGYGYQNLFEAIKI